MSTASTLAAYAAGLVVVFGVAAGIGNAVGPVSSAGSDGSDTTHEAPSTTSSVGTENASDGHDG